MSRDKFEVINRDCNAEVKKIVNNIKERFRKPIILTFVDPEGMEIRWETMQILSNEFMNLDFMINMTIGASRVAGRIQSGFGGDKPVFEDFFGDKAEKILSDISEGKKVEEVYENSVKQILGRPMGTKIAVRRIGESMIYHMLGYTRTSSTGSPWVRGFLELKKRIDKPGIDSEYARKILDIIKGRQASF